MSDEAKSAAFAARDVATGITVEERIQPAGECAQSGSDVHVFVVQSVPVDGAQQRWEGVRREGPMHSGEVALLRHKARTWMVRPDLRDGKTSQGKPGISKPANLI